MKSKNITLSVNDLALISEEIDMGTGFPVFTYHQKHTPVCPVCSSQNLVLLKRANKDKRIRDVDKDDNPIFIALNDANYYRCKNCYHSFGLELTRTFNSYTYRFIESVIKDQAQMKVKDLCKKYKLSTHTLKRITDFFWDKIQSEVGYILPDTLFLIPILVGKTKFFIFIDPVEGKVLDLMEEKLLLLMKVQSQVKAIYTSEIENLSYLKSIFNKAEFYIHPESILDGGLEALYTDAKRVFLNTPVENKDLIKFIFNEETKAIPAVLREDYRVIELVKYIKMIKNYSKNFPEFPYTQISDRYSYFKSYVKNLSKELKDFNLFQESRIPKRITDRLLPKIKTYINRISSIETLPNKLIKKSRVKRFFYLDTRFEGAIFTKDGRILYNSGVKL